MKTLATLLLTAIGPIAAAQTLPAGEPPTTAPSTQPTTQASTQLVTQPAKRVISRITGQELLPPPADYDVLSTHTVFMKTRIAPPPPPPKDQPAQSVSPTARAEAAMVFNGVTEIDGVGYAVFEDTAAGKINGYKVGDPIAGGKITGIRLDGLDYESNGKTIHISIGQTLEGGEAPDVLSRAVVTGGNGSSTQPASTGNPGEDAVLRALREKRRRELGQ